jgi:hypothetical protein
MGIDKEELCFVTDDDDDGAARSGNYDSSQAP